MFAKINHVAMVSNDYAMLGKFYETLFGMKTSPSTRPGRAITVGDGYVGLNINPRKPGRPAGLDHFGVQVDDVEAVFAKMDAKYPKAKWVKRPGNRPFAGITANDPDGNIFDLSQSGMENRRDVYDEKGWEADRAINHFALRTMNPEACAEFYADVLELQPANREPYDENYYLTDGRITLVLMPWAIQNYANTGITRPGPDHFGFKVESLDAFKQDLQEMIEGNQNLTPRAVGLGPEGQARLTLFEHSCPHGGYHMADPDDVLVHVSE
jgi:catechol 2,3-dioxygenase-like lactoylglutathione lyase family enzyme